MGIVNRDCKGSQFSLKAWRLTMILFLTKFIYGAFDGSESNTTEHNPIILMMVAQNLIKRT